MVNRYKKIALVTNEPCQTSGAEKSALILAQSNQSDVVLLDSIRAPFRLSVESNFSTNQLFERAVESKRKYLEKVQTQFAQEGINTSTCVTTGLRTSKSLIEAATQAHCDIMIRYLKGQSSRALGRFGETAKNLMRACPMPVLFTERTLSGSPKVLACICLDHGPQESAAILTHARKLARDENNLFVLCCWQFDATNSYYEFMDEDLAEETRTETETLYNKLFDNLIRDLGLANNQRASLQNVNPVKGIHEFCQMHGIDIAVMCSASLDHPTGRQLGSTIERTIGELPCALMTVKPVGFQPFDEKTASIQSSSPLTPVSP